MAWKSLLAQGEKMARRILVELPAERAAHRWASAKAAADAAIENQLPLQAPAEPPEGFNDLTMRWEFAISTPLDRTLSIYLTLAYDGFRDEWLPDLYYSPSGMPAGFIVPTFGIVRDAGFDDRQIERLPREKWWYAANLPQAVWYAARSFDNLASLRAELKREMSLAQATS